MALPPTPAKQSITTVGFWHLWACVIAICSGVTEYQPCSSIWIPSSYFEKRSYLWNQYFSTTGLTPSSVTLLFWVWADKAPQHKNEQLYGFLSVWVQIKEGNFVFRNISGTWKYMSCAFFSRRIPNKECKTQKKTIFFFWESKGVKKDYLAGGKAWTF